MVLLSAEIEPRLYQQVIFNTAAARNTLAVLPTGMGKTLIAELLAAHRLEHYPGSKIVVMAPTRPLVQQHLDTFQKDFSLPEGAMVLFTGNVPPAKRAVLWQDAIIIFTTPQGFENDILSGRISFKDVSLLVVDEAHRAVKDYAYVFLAERYQKEAEHARILGLTASPGSDKETIEEVCRNLCIEEIEYRSQESADVLPYIQEVVVEHIKVRMPDEFKSVHAALRRCFEQRIEALKQLGVVNRNAFQNKTGMLKAQAALHARAARGERDYQSLKSMSLLAEALKVQHAIELIETQGVAPLLKYAEKLSKEAARGQSKAVQNVVRDANYKTAVVLLERLHEQEIEHPKLRAVQKVVLKELYGNKEAKVIVFNQYRDQAVRIKEALDAINVPSKVFVGQMKKGETGMSQKEQHVILEEFRNGEFNVLIATSVAEEGLDIPKVDTVIFYEPVPSAIRTVQRRGRTGRLEKGRIVMLITEGTRDVAYRFAAQNKEKRMYRVLAEVRKELRQRNGEPLAKEKVLSAFAEKRGDDGKSAAADGGVRIVADHREKGSDVLKAILARDAKLVLEQLPVGDYLLSDRVVVEYKTVPDFVDSIVDGRLLAQLRGLRQYARPLIVIQGDQDLYSIRRIHPNAILGMLAAITVSYNIPLLFTKDSDETAALLLLIARKEKDKGHGDVQYHSQKPLTTSELQESIVASLPGVGPGLARNLLARFRTIRAVADASAEELVETEKVGQKRAKEIHDILNREYDPKA